MDPLSLTASIIAVVTALHSAAQGLEKILSIREAPEQLAQVYNEVSRSLAQTRSFLPTVTLPSAIRSESFSLDHKGYCTNIERNGRRDHLSFQPAHEPSH